MQTDSGIAVGLTTEQTNLKSKETGSLKKGDRFARRMKEKHKLQISLTLTIFSFLFFPQCKGELEKYKESVIENYSSQSEEKKKSINLLLSQVKSEYTLQNSYKNQEEAIRNFLLEILDPKTEFPKSICNSYDIEKIIMPNILLEKYGMVYMSPEDRQTTIRTRQLLGISRIRSKFRNPTLINSPEVTFQLETKKIRQHNAIRFINLENIKVTVPEKKVIILEEIKSILSVGGEYKVCIVAP
ncbi:hypothetical protein LEP1GSC192_3046 [Leptospira sp. B5-022]|nr:hypothetical protein LEP1GSC192_3046 [Leptospira sp. B5-022]